MEIVFSLTLLSYLSLSLSLIISNSYYFPSVFFVSCISLFFLLLAFLNSERSFAISEPPKFNLTLALLYGTLVSQVLYFFGLAPVFQGWPEARIPLFLFQGGAILLTVLLAFSTQSLRRFFLFFFLLLGVWLFSSFWVLNRLPLPTIDVWVFSQRAAEALLNGENPYSKFFDVAADNRATPVTSLYIYPPLPLVLSTLSYFFTHEVRYAGLFCQFASAGFLYGIARRSDKSPSAATFIAAFFLFHPRWHYVLQQAWIEPMAVTFLFGSLYFLLRQRYCASAVLAGLFLCAKQYLLPLGLVMPRFFPFKGRHWLLAAAIFAATFLPFLIASPSDLYRNLVVFHIAAPFREESLSLASFLFKTFSWKLPAGVPFAALALVLFIGARKKNLFRFALSATLAFFLFFWLNKQAFLNYYFFVQSLMVLTLALLPTQAEKKGFHAGLS